PRRLPPRGEPPGAGGRARGFAPRPRIQTANALVVGLDAAGNVTIFNEGAERITGYTRADLAGRGWFEVLVPRDRYPEVWQEFRRLTADGGVPRTFENPIRTKAGDERHILWQNTVLREGSEVTGTISFGVDVTERKRAEEGLREPEGRLQLFIEHAPASLAMFDREMRYLAVSRRWRDDYALGDRDLLGRSHYEIFPEIPQRWRDVHRRGLGGEVVRAEEERFERADGRVQWLRWEVRPWQAANGAVGGIVIFTEDITERKRAESALRESEARLRLALEATGIGLWDWNLRTDLWYATPSYFQMLGYDPDVDGQNREVWGGRTHPEDRAFVVRKMETVRDRGEHGFDLEFRFRHQDGSYRWINSIGRAVEFDPQGRAVRMLGLQIDVTERRLARDEIQRLNETLEHRVAERTAQLEAANRELEAFSYAVSHDLRAPLRAIDGFTGVLVEDHGDRLDDEGRQVCGVIRHNAGRMGQLIDDLLALARVSRRELAAQSVDMAALAGAAFSEALAPADRDRVELRLGPLAPAVGDPGLLRQVWANLLGNAVKFSSRRERPVIEVGCGEAPGEVRYWVRDNGAGFDPRYAHQLFGVFQRLHGQGEFEGSGVGLAVVQRIIERHGGRAWAVGEVDRGATFTFALPRRGPGPARERA
ncbi:MAG: PAS domain-containing sensor histidine kinase, partial [Deferrisomatales bacterium]